MTSRANASVRRSATVIAFGALAVLASTVTARSDQAPAQGPGQGTGASISPPSQPPVSVPSPRSLDQRVGPEEESPIARYHQLMAIRGQQLTQEVNGAIADAQAVGRTDPAAGIAALKRAESAVATAPDIEPQVHDQLMRRIHSTILELRSVRERQDIDKVKNAEREAQVEARQRSLEQMSIEETRLTQLIDQSRALMVQAVHGDDAAYEEAEAVGQEAINVRPGNGAATQAKQRAQSAGSLNKAYRLRNLRADRLLEACYLVELAHVPFPDEPPIEWPNAQVWRALTERRKKWAVTDVRTESKSEQRINQALDENVDFVVEAQPLKDALEFISKRFNIPIVIDSKALEDASIEPTTEVHSDVQGIKLKNMLKLLLEQLPQPLTYVVEDEVMKITTVEKAKDMLTIRMYPVGDLLLGPTQLQAMAGSGGGGGMSGGAGGGGMGGGAGGGGMGGGGMGGGMMGGGQFSVPSGLPGLP
jgi:hypothetical protein